MGLNKESGIALGKWPKGERNLITDPTAQYFEQMFIKGFVSEFKHRDAIYAWDLGNECNVTGSAKNRWETTSWVALIANAIKVSAIRFALPWVCKSVESFTRSGT